MKGREMTREEAKEVFLNRGFIDGIYNGDKWREACIVISKWLEQEPTTKNNLEVDWDELKRKIFMEVDGGTDGNWLRYGDVCENISDSIDDFKANLPPVTPQEPRWIPDSERLPEEDGRYLITYCDGDKIETQEAVYVEEEDEGKWYDTTEVEITLAVIAWMPLPQPYKEVKE